MTENRRGLGRGLSALLQEAGPAMAGRGAASEVRDLAIELVRANPAQPRRRFDQTALDELAASIAARGVLQPILVRPAPGASGEYQIVAGERRWRAAQLARLRSIPAIVRDIADEEVAIVALIENLQRADLGALEEASAYADLFERLGRDAARVAEAVGKSRPHVANSLRLLRLPPRVRDQLEAGELSAGHARAIAGAADPAALANDIVRRGLNVRQAEALARGAGKERPRRRERGKDPDTVALERDLGQAIGLKVEITDRDGVGEVRVAYRSLEQLDEVCRRLSRQ